MPKRFTTVLLCMSAACTPSPEARTTSPDANETAAPPPPKDVSAEAPPAEGRAAFEGMVRPTKGGYEVRGVIVDDSALRKALAGAPGSDPKNPDWFLGAVVHVEGEVHKHEAPPEQGKDGLVERVSIPRGSSSPRR
jgi:hypothetical protein